jgi:hypothetical protein
VLEGGQAIHEPSAAAVDKEGGPDAGSGIAKAFMDGGPAIDTVCVGLPEGDVQFRRKPTAVSRSPGRRVQTPKKSALTAKLWFFGWFSF